MIIRIILILFIIILLGWFLGQRSTTRGQAWAKVGAFLLFIFSMTTIMSPNIANSVANKLGVGRGADLLLYTLTVVFLAYVVSQYMHRQDEQGHITELARKISLMEANNSPHNVELLKKNKVR